MPVHIQEPISVAVMFEHGRVRPMLFYWKDKKISIDRISFHWQTMEGAAKIFHFSAVAGGNLYELVFNMTELTWKLKQISTESYQT